MKNKMIKTKGALALLLTLSSTFAWAEGKGGEGGKTGSGGGGVIKNSNDPRLGNGALREAPRSSTVELGIANEYLMNFGNRTIFSVSYEGINGEKNLTWLQMKGSFGIGSNGNVNMMDLEFVPVSYDAISDPTVERSTWKMGPSIDFKKDIAQGNYGKISINAFSMNAHLFPGETFELILGFQALGYLLMQNTEGAPFEEGFMLERMYAHPKVKIFLSDQIAMKVGIEADISINLAPDWLVLGKAAQTLELEIADKFTIYEKFGYLCKDFDDARTHQDLYLQLGIKGRI